MTSDVENLQPTDLTNQGGFYPDVINDALDRATIQIQQMQTEVDSSFRLPLSSTASTELPNPFGGYVLGWNASGDALINIAAATGTSLVDLASSTGSNLIGYQPSGSNAVATTVQTKLRQYVSVMDYMTAAQIADVKNFTGAIDVTTAVQTAVTANKSIEFPPGLYLVSQINLQAMQKISGYGARIKASTAAGKVFTIPETTGGLQTTDFTEISGLNIEGYSTTITSGSAAIYTSGGSSSLCLRDVKVQQFDIGFNLFQTQFASFYSIKAYACNVGVYLKSDVTNGGANSNSFYDLIALACTKYGVLINGQAPFNTTANYFRNYTGNGNTCAMGLFNSQCFVDGGAPESNLGTATTFDGCASSGGTFYVNDSNLFLSNLSDQDAVSTTVVYAENNSDVNLVNSGGFGRPGAKYCTTDATSTVIASGNTLIDGSLQNVFNTVTSSSPSNGGNLYHCPDTTYLSVSLPNECSSPLTSTLANPNLATPTTIWDGVYGLVGNVVFAASAGNQDSNRIFLGSISNNSGLSVIGVSVYSATNTTVVLGFYGAAYRQPVNLIAGRWTRLYYVMQNVAITSTSSYVIYPLGTDGPTIKIAKAMIYSAATYDAGAVQAMNAVLGGAYNPQVGALHYGRKTNAAPTTGSWLVGDVVYNSAPASAGYIGWVCTTAGTPGTWKTFGLIS
jgi:hypothetical protein